MKAPKTKCPKCDSYLMLSDSNPHGDYPATNEASTGSISLHIICSDCDYDAYDRFDYRGRVDADSPNQEWVSPIKGDGNIINQDLPPVVIPRGDQA